MEKMCMIIVMGSSLLLLCLMYEMPKSNKRLAF